MDGHASFGYWVRRRRKALDLTQDALAQQVGCSVMTIRKIEGDIRRPSRQIAEILAVCLGIAAHERESFIKAARAEMAVDRLPQPTEQLEQPHELDADAELEALGLDLAEVWQPGRASLPTGTVTLLFADVPRSARLWEGDSSAAEAALVRYHAILRRAIEANDGAVFKLVGDLVCAAFARAPDAIRAALGMQRGLLAASWDDLEPPHARTAIHTGSVDMHNDDYVGLPLSRIARLLEVGHAGQIVLSLATYELVRDGMPSGATLHDLGTHRLRDLARPEQIFQLSASDLPADFPPLSTLDRRPTNLPLQPTPLIGREHEVAQVCALLRRDNMRLLTLTGPGGTGKTRLGLQAAAELLDTFADGVYLTALAPIRDPALVIEAIATTLGVKEGGNQPLLTLLKQHVYEKQLLLVLDNFEQVVNAAPLVSELLAAAPQLKILVTSRASLQLYGESEFPVPPLALPNPSRLPPIERLTQYEAVRLFIERARAVKPDFTVTDANAPAVAEICVRLDGLPLAIELAAVRVKVLTPQALLARLSRRLHVLTGGARNLPARQQTLRDAIAWSHELLPTAEQALFARLAVFAGDYTVEAVEAICHVDGNAISDPLDSIQALVNNSLVRQESGTGGEPRLHMLETIREYALEQLAARGEASILRIRHAEYYLELAEAGKPTLDMSTSNSWLAALDAEHDNLRAALSWAIEREDKSLALALGGALWRYWDLRNYFTEGRRWLLAALERSDTSTTPLHAEAYSGAGTFCWRQGDYSQARELHKYALNLYQALGDTQGVAFTLNNLGVQWYVQGNFSDALQLFGESLVLAQREGHTRISGYVMFNMGDIARHQGDYQRATELYKESLALFHQLGDQYQACYGLLGLGSIAASQGTYEQAIIFYREALLMAQTQGHLVAVADCFEGIACTLVLQGQVIRTARLFGASEQLREAIEAPRELVEQRSYAKAVEIVRAALDQATYERVWLAGRRMALEEAIAYALGEEAIAYALGNDQP